MITVDNCKSEGDRWVSSEENANEEQAVKHSSGKDIGLKATGPFPWSLVRMSAKCDTACAHGGRLAGNVRGPDRCNKQHK